MVPFRLFHSWFDMDGFDGLVHDFCLQAPEGELYTNPWVKFKKKF